MEPKKLSRIFWVIALIIGGISAYMVNSRGLILLVPGFRIFFWILNPWLFLLFFIPGVNLLVQGDAYFDMNPVAELFADTRYYDTDTANIYNPILLFLIHILFWRLLFYLFTKRSLDEQLKLKEKKILRILIILTLLIFPAVVITAKVEEYYTKFEEKEYHEITNFNVEIFKSIVAGTANKNACEKVVMGKWGDKYICYFVLALKNQEPNLCLKAANEADRILCKDYLKKIQENSLDKTECMRKWTSEELGYSNLFLDCNTYLGIYFQDMSMCSRAAGHNEICSNYIFSK